jgi:EpsI family protein
MGRGGERMNPGRLAVALMLVVSAAVLARSARRQDAVPRLNLGAVPYRIASWVGRDAEPLDEETVRILAADAYLNRNYAPKGSSAPLNLYVAYYGAQRPGVSIHSPLHCLPGTGWETLDIATVAVPLADGTSGEARRLIVRKNRDRALVLYWYAIHGRMLANEIASKAWLLHDSIRLRRSDAALVRIVVPIGGAGDPAAAEQRGLTFARGVIPYLLQLWS